MCNISYYIGKCLVYCIKEKYSFFFKEYLFERERAHMSGSSDRGRGETESQADSVLSMEADMALNLMTLRS